MTAGERDVDEAVANALHFFTERADAFGGYECACGASWLEDGCSRGGVEEQWEQAQAVAALVAQAKRDAWLLEDHPQPWPTGTVHSALVTTNEIRAALGDVEQPSKPRKSAALRYCEILRGTNPSPPVLKVIDEIEAEERAALGEQP